MAAAQSLSPLLQCADVRQAYGQIAVLNGVSLELAPSETLAIMGRSGCGKSTLLRCLALLQEPQAGDASLAGQPYMAAGKPLYALWQIRSQITMVFQNLNLFAHLTGLRNITLPLEEVRKLPKRESKDLACQIADELEVSSVLGKYPDAMSGGQAQRIALARAMVLQPTVLLLDEITSALDPESVRSVVNALHKIRSTHSRQQPGIIVVTHDLRFARRFAHRIAFMHEGRIVEVIRSSQPVAECQREEARQFFEQCEEDGR